MQEGIPTLLTVYNEYNGNPSAEGTQTFRTHVSFSSILNRKLQYNSLNIFYTMRPLDVDRVLKLFCNER